MLELEALLEELGSFIRSPEKPLTYAGAIYAEMRRKWPCESASAEVETDAGDKNGHEKDNDEVETEVFLGADLLVDKV